MTGQSMADVLTEHHISLLNDGGWHCAECGVFSKFKEATAHQAAVLSAAGFGPVQEAKADGYQDGYSKGYQKGYADGAALTDGYKVGHNHGFVKGINHHKEDQP